MPRCWLMLMLISLILSGHTIAVDCALPPAAAGKAYPHPTLPTPTNMTSLISAISRAVPRAPLGEIEGYLYRLMEVRMRSASTREGTLEKSSKKPPKQRGNTAVPDMLDRSPKYAPSPIGTVSPKDEFPLTEGYRPKEGYLRQSPGCEKVMRIWLEKCAFKDHPKSYYHKSAGKMFPPGKKGKDGKLHTANYIGNILYNRQPKLQDYNGSA